MVDEANTDVAEENPPQDTAAQPNPASEPPIAPGAPSEPDIARQEIPLYARKMMDRFHSKAEAAEAQLADARAELELLRRQSASQPSQQAPAAPAPTLQPPQPQQTYDIETRVAQEVARRQFQADAQRADEEGLRVHGENWPNIISNLNAFGGFRNNQRDLEFIIQTGKAPAIMAELAKVQNGSPLYEQIMGIPNEAKRHARLLELGFATAAAPAAAAPSRPQSSNAPPPIDPVTGRGTHAPGPTDLYDPRLAGTAKEQSSDQYDAEWYRIRAEQKYQRFQRMNGGR